MADIKRSNLLFKSDNLKVLKALQKTHSGSVKCAYLDPPYNTGINRKHFHDDRDSSDWGHMMRQRLEIVKDLLSEDGSVWISIDDTELCNLRNICNEVFGPENFLATVTWQHRINWDGYKGKFLLDHSYIVAYSKSKSFNFANNAKPSTVWLESNVGGHVDALTESKKLFGDNNTFSTPKPERLMSYLIEVTTNKGDLIIDCFSGSGTTGSAAQKLNRQWIMMEIGDQADTHIYPRMSQLTSPLDPKKLSSYDKSQLSQGFFYFKDPEDYLALVQKATKL